MASAEQAAKSIKDGMIIGTASGDASAFPKAFFSALAKRAGQGERFQIQLWTSGPIAEEIDGMLTKKELLSRRLGQQSNALLRKAVNQGKITFIDLPSGMFPMKVREGRFGRLDVAVLEAMAITEDGFIVPTTAVLDGPSHVQVAEKIIIELNHAYPPELEGIHDIYIPEPHPYRKPIPLIHVTDRIGFPHITVDPKKITAIIESNQIYSSKDSIVMDEESLQVGRNVVSFLKEETEKGKLPKTLFPLELGLGNMSEAVMQELLQSDLGPLDIYTAVIGDGVLDLMDAEKVRGMSASGLYFSHKGFEKFWGNLKKYKGQIVLRPVEIADCSEMILRLGVIAINGALEVDIYGHVNSTHVQGSQVITGIGGSVEFAQNSLLSIFILPSSRNGGKISSVVPMATHVDHTEHAVDVIVTDQGVADLRGLDPVERAHQVIENCAHPDFRPYLRGYLKQAKKENFGHEPHLLRKAFSLHLNLLKNGTMREYFTEDIEGGTNGF